MSLLTIRSLAGDQQVAPRGVTHISCHYKNTIEGAGENRRTNEQTLGVNSRAKRGVMQHYISDSIYGLTLAWITSENSKKLLECRHLDSIFFTVAGPSLLCYCVRSQPHLSVPVANSRVCGPAANCCQLLCPTNSLLVPLPLPATPRFQVQKPFVWFRAKTDKGIVCLAGHPYSVTVCHKRSPIAVEERRMMISHRVRRNEIAECPSEITRRCRHSKS